MNWKRFFAMVVTFVVALSVGSFRLAAQTTTTGDVVGVVTDPSNAVVPDAKISIKDNTKGTTQETTANNDGAYHFYLLSPDPYTISVTATGFETTTRQVTVALGQIVTVDIRLTLGASTQTVTVTEAAPLIQTENGDTASALSQQQVANVPNPGNDLSAIAQLAPGVIVNSQGGFGNVEAFGLPATSNLFTINGMDDNDPFLNLNNSGASNLLLGSNEVQEADVVTNGYSSAYGTFSGINVNYLTKSGGNGFHGNAAYYWNGRAMNANDWFNNDRGGAANGFPRAFDNANQWAASIGGPIKRDKLFFFLNTEGLRVLIPIPSTISVPSPAFEGSVVENLTLLGDTASIPFYCQNITVTALDGTKTTCPGPLSARSGHGMFNFFNEIKNIGSAVPFPGADASGCDVTSPIPVGDGVGASVGGGHTVFNGFGVANPCTLSLRVTPVNFAREKQIAGRTDWNIGNNDRAYLRMQYDQGVQPTVTDPVNPLFFSQSNQPEYQGQLNETHVFNPTLSNQFLVAATWYSAIFKAANTAATLAAFPGSLFPNDGSLTSIGGVNFDFPQGRNVTQIQFGDDVSKTVGNHTISFGAKYHKNYVSDHDNGAFSTPLLLPLFLADYANGGDPNAAGSIGTVGLQNFAQSQDLPIRLYEVAGYVEDSWRIRPNLTITPALRIEHASNPICVTDCFAQFAAPFSTIVGEPTGAYNQEIQVGRRQGLLSYQNIQPEPRISFAWQPFAGAAGRLKSNLVIRGGAGIFYDIFPGAVATNMSQNPNLYNPFTISSVGIGGSCPGFLSPDQTPGSNLFDCAVAANNAFNSAFATGGNKVASVPNATFTQPETKAPQFQKWSLEIQKGFGPNDSIDIGYFGNHGIHTPILNNSVNAFGPFPNTPGGAFAGLPTSAPTAQYGTLEFIQSIGVSNYNGVVASYKHRFSGWAGSGVFQFNYTYGKALDEISNGGFFQFAQDNAGGSAASLNRPQDPNNIRNMYGPADYDVRHSLNANYVWELPIRKALMGHGWAPLVEGWQVSGALFFRTGFPFTVTDPTDSNTNNYGGTIFPNPSAPITDVNCNSEKDAGVTATGKCAYAAGFAGIGGGSETTFGANGLRNAFRGPSYFDTDFSFTKKTKIPRWERGELQLGLQFFNVLNHPNFNLPVNSITNGNFGTLQNTVNPPTSILGSFLGGDASPRLIQVKAQLVF